MAKKNLHTKRSLSNVESNKLYSINTSFRRRSSVPDSAGIDQQSYYSKPSSAEFSPNFDQNSPFSGEFFPQSQSYTNQFIEIATGNDVFDPFAPANPALDSVNSTASEAPFYGTEPISPAAEEFEASKLTPLFGSTQLSRGFSSVLYNSDTLLSKSLGSMNLTDFPAAAESFTSSRSSSFSYSPPVHPGADQNPPCNTLYVGNLPNDSCEEELRHLFQCCPGYKRLSFKTRSNGPMCFVEVCECVADRHARFPYFNIPYSPTHSV